MKMRTKVWLITAASLVLIGGILFAGIMSTLRWDFMKLSTAKYITNTYEISEAFDGVSMNTDTADILFTVSNDNKCKVECYEEENAKHFVTVKEGKLAVTLVEKRSIYDYIRSIGLNFGSPKITVYLPKAKYTSLLIRENAGDIEMPKDFAFKNVDISLTTGNVNFFASAFDSMKIKTSTGDIRVENASAGALDLSVSTGEIFVSDVVCENNVNINLSTGKTNLTDIQCKNVISSGNTGDISLKNVIATEKFSIERSTGDVRFDGSDAAEIFVKTDTGDVKGRLLTEKVFITETSTGRIAVPKTTAGGKCDITTSTGNVKIDVSP